MQEMNLDGYNNPCRDPAMVQYVRDWSNDTQCVSDQVEHWDEELAGLTILDHPHITGCGSIVDTPEYLFG